MDIIGAGVTAVEEVVKGEEDIVVVDIVVVVSDVNDGAENITSDDRVEVMGLDVLAEGMVVMVAAATAAEELTEVELLVPEVDISTPKAEFVVGEAVVAVATFFSILSSNHLRTCCIIEYSIIILLYHLRISIISFYQCFSSGWVVNLLQSIHEPHLKTRHCHWGQIGCHDKFIPSPPEVTFHPRLLSLSLRLPTQADKIPVLREVTNGVIIFNLDIAL